MLIKFMPLSINKPRRIRFIFIIQWVLLVYILAALIWWFIALNKQNRQMAVYEMEVIKKDDPTNIKALANIIEIEKRKTAQYMGEGFVFFLFIITGAVFIYRAVNKQLKTSLQQQSFMMAITHELKTPIAIAKLNLETLQKRKLEDKQQQRLIQNTLQETNRLNALCNNMLLATQMDDGGYVVTKEKINFSDLVNQCVNENIIRFPQRQYRQSFPQNIFIEGDSMLLQMAVNNLLDNANKYSAKDAAITIVVSDINNKIILQVKDEGKGIADEDKKKIFDKFYRAGNVATKAAKGTGLGLYLTKKIAIQHKAVIFVTDNVKTGSIFTIEFFKMV
jgi:K+-sensing histidine kinase KdpD